MEPLPRKAKLLAKERISMFTKYFETENKDTPLSEADSSDNEDDLKMLIESEENTEDKEYVDLPPREDEDDESSSSDEIESVTSSEHSFLDDIPDAEKRSIDKELVEYATPPETQCEYDLTDIHDFYTQEKYMFDHFAKNNLWNEVQIVLSKCLESLEALPPCTSTTTPSLLMIIHHLAALLRNLLPFNTMVIREIHAAIDGVVEQVGAYNLAALRNWATESMSS